MKKKQKFIFTETIAVTSVLLVRFDSQIYTYNMHLHLSSWWIQYQNYNYNKNNCFHHSFSKKTDEFSKYVTTAANFTIIIGLQVNTIGWNLKCLYVEKIQPSWKINWRLHDVSKIAWRPLFLPLHQPAKYWIHL